MRSVFLLFIIILWTSCSTSVRPISYGKDACEHCRMTIMDKKFGAELITKKGKIFVFDSDECLAQYVIKNPEQEKDMAAIWITLIDLDSKKVLLTERVECKAAGFGFRNYWASTIKEAIDEASDRYKGWKKQYGG